MRKKLSNKKLLKYLIEYIIMTLNELAGTDSGEFWAFLECLEILSKWSGFKKYGIKDIEAHFTKLRRI